jgi:hypothetical protein
MSEVQTSIKVASPVPFAPLFQQNQLPSSSCSLSSLSQSNIKLESPSANVLQNQMFMQANNAPAGAMQQTFNWPMLSMQMQQNWLLQQMEFYRLAQCMSFQNMTGLPCQGFRPVQGSRNGSLQPFMIPGSQSQVQGFSCQQADNENQDSENVNLNKRSKPVKKVKKSTESDDSSSNSFSLNQRKPALGRPKKSSLLQDRMAILKSILIKRDSSDPLSSFSETREGIPTGADGNVTASTDSQETHEVGRSSSSALPTVNLLAKLEKGFEIIKPRIDTSDMAFIRNYSRIIGFPLKTTQRNTKLGYFTSICPHEGCPVNIIIRKFKLITKTKIEHNHPVEGALA